MNFEKFRLWKNQKCEAFKVRERHFFTRSTREREIKQTLTIRLGGAQYANCKMSTLIILPLSFIGIHGNKILRVNFYGELKEPRKERSERGENVPSSVFFSN